MARRRDDQGVTAVCQGHVDRTADVESRQGFEGVVLRRIAVVAHAAAEPHVGIGNQRPAEGFEIERRPGLPEKPAPALLPGRQVGRKRGEPPQQPFAVGRRATVVFVGLDGNPDRDGGRLSRDNFARSCLRRCRSRPARGLSRHRAVRGATRNRCRGNGRRCRLAAPDQIERAEQVVERLVERVGTHAEGSVSQPHGIGIEAFAGDPHIEAPLHLIEQFGERAGITGIANRRISGLCPDRGGKQHHGCRSKQQRADSGHDRLGFHAKIGIFVYIILYLHKKILYLHTLSEQTAGRDARRDG